MQVEVIGGPKDGVIWEVPDNWRHITIGLPIGDRKKRTLAEYIEEQPRARVPIQIRSSDGHPVVVWPKA